MINGIGSLSYAYERYTGSMQMAPEEDAGTKIVRNPGESTEKQAGRKSSPAECETCRNRKYQDGSDEMVSFKAAAHISPNAAAARVTSPTPTKKPKKITARLYPVMSPSTAQSVRNAGAPMCPAVQQRRRYDIIMKKTLIRKK